MEKLIDMHIHSYYSDGQFKPIDLIRIARENNVGLISITDHDDIRNISEVKNIQNLGLNLINGVELSTLTNVEDKKILIHLLGYGFDENNHYLNESLNQKREIRYNINKDYIFNLYKNLQFIDKDIMEMVECDRFIRISRLILKYMEDKHYTQTEQNIVINYIKNNEIFYPNYEFSDDEAINLILHSKGIPVLAHPYQYKLTYHEERILLDRLKSLGLLGLETHHSGDTIEGMQMQMKLCEDYDLYWSVGSDFHTDYNDLGNQIGLGKNNNLCKSDCSLIKKLEKSNKIYRR